MDQVKVSQYNESYVTIDTDPGIVKELYDYFAFYASNYQNDFRFKSKRWDGKIRLFSLKTRLLYHGLSKYIQTFCEERSYEYIDSLEQATEFSVLDALKFIVTLNIPEKYEIREYQLKMFVDSVRYRRVLFLSPPSSGKTLMIYLMLRWLLSQEEKGLILTTRINLVQQMIGDFIDYGWNDAEKFCHVIFAGQDKETDKPIRISTWQSLYDQEDYYFKQFRFVFGDEAHNYEAKSLRSILEHCSNARWRIGLSGSLRETKVHKLILEGLFGPARELTTTQEMIRKKQASEILIKCIVLKHGKHSREVYKKQIESDKKPSDKKKIYQKEVEFLVTHERRNRFIVNLALSLKNNTLILYRLVDLHGKILKTMMEEELKKNNIDRKVYFISGKTESEIRENIRALLETHDNAFLIASLGTFSEGSNLRNLHNVIFTSPIKGRVRAIQSIGRMLRLHKNKTEATLYDIADDLGNNITMEHFRKRLQIYASEKHRSKIYTVELKE